MADSGKHPSSEVNDGRPEGPKRTKTSQPPSGLADVPEDRAVPADPVPPEKPARKGYISVQVGTDAPSGSDPDFSHWELEVPPELLESLPSYSETAAFGHSASTGSLAEIICDKVNATLDDRLADDAVADDLKCYLPLLSEVREMKEPIPADAARRGLFRAIYYETYE